MCTVQQTVFTRVQHSNFFTISMIIQIESAAYGVHIL